jgi:hypothetical protein
MDDKYSGDIDPEIAALLKFDGPPKPRDSKPGLGAPSQKPTFDDLFSSGGSESAPKEPSTSSFDPAQKTFAPITQFSEPPKPYFEDKDFYKLVLKDSGESASRVHQILSELLNATDPETRGKARLRFVPAWWDFLSTLVHDLGPKLSQPKLLALRYGVLLPSLISAEQRTVLASVIWSNHTSEPVHYVDEWLQKVGSGEVAPLATDEEFKAVKKSTDNSAIQQRVEKLQGQYQAQSNLIQIKFQEMKEIEASVADSSLALQRHGQHPVFSQLSDVFNSDQRAALNSLQEALKKLSALDKEVAVYFHDLEKISNELTQAQSRLDDSGTAVVDTKTVLRELGSLRQMAKLSCGRQGNHFPVVMKNFMPGRLEDIGTRENVLHIMGEVERLDPGLFQRTFKGSVNRIVPHVILLPSYGEYGLCWEPFEKFNRSTSRGRIGLPMYSKNLKTAVIFALGDLRWQVAKEKAGYRWMEEGLTGWYYQWFTDKNMRGDVREYFVQDYILWITKESEGTQKLDKDVRGIFWRNMPFPQEVRDMLKNRGFVYNELYKKDINRSMSDGY